MSEETTPKCKKCRDEEESLRTQILELAEAWLDRDAEETRTARLLVDTHNELQRVKAQLTEEGKTINEQLRENELKILKLESALRAATNKAEYYEKREAAVKQLDAAVLMDANEKLKIRVRGLKKDLFEAKSELNDYRKENCSGSVSKDQAVYVSELMKLTDIIHKYAEASRTWEARYLAAKGHVDLIQDRLGKIQELVAARFEREKDPDAAFDRDLFYSELGGKVTDLIGFIESRPFASTVLNGAKRILTQSKEMTTSFISGLTETVK